MFILLIKHFLYIFVPDKGDAKIVAKANNWTEEF